MDFTPKKKSKGIVFYEERMVELKESPHLARGAVLLTAVKVESEVVVKDEEILSTIKKRRGKQKTNASPNVEEALLTPVPDMNIKTPVAKRKRVKIETEAKVLDFSSPLPVEKKKRMPRKPKSLVLESSAPLVTESVDSGADALLLESLSVKQIEVESGISALQDLPAHSNGEEGKLDLKIHTRSASKRIADQMNNDLDV